MIHRHYHELKLLLNSDGGAPKYKYSFLLVLYLVHVPKPKSRFLSATCTTAKYVLIKCELCRLLQKHKVDFSDNPSLVNESD